MHYLASGDARHLTLAVMALLLRGSYGVCLVAQQIASSECLLYIASGSLVEACISRKIFTQVRRMTTWHCSSLVVALPCPFRTGSTNSQEVLRPQLFCVFCLSSFHPSACFRAALVQLTVTFLDDPDRRFGQVLKCVDPDSGRA